MFGTLKPKPRELTNAKKIIYRDHYCGVCAGLGTHFDTISRATLSHDAVLLSLVAEGLQTEASPKSKTRCPLNPLHHRRTTDENSFPIRYASAVHTLLVGLWLEDKVEDAGKNRSAIKIGESLWQKRFQKARSMLEDYGLELSFVEALTKSQAKVEETNPTIEEASKVTESILAYFFSNLVGEEQDLKRSKLASFGRLVGRVIYLTDALKDVRKDRRRGHFNLCLKSGRLNSQKTKSVFSALRKAIVEMGKGLEELELKRTYLVCEEILTKQWSALVEKEIARVEFLLENEGRKQSFVEKWRRAKLAFMLFLSQFWEELRRAFEFQRYAFAQSFGANQCRAQKCRTHVPALAMSASGPGASGPMPNPNFESLKEEKEKKKKRNSNSGDDGGVIMSNDKNDCCCHYCDCCDGYCFVCGDECQCCDCCSCCECCECCPCDC